MTINPLDSASQSSLQQSILGNWKQVRVSGDSLLAPFAKLLDRLQFFADGSLATPAFLGSSGGGNYSFADLTHIRIHSGGSGAVNVFEITILDDTMTLRQGVILLEYRRESSIETTLAEQPSYVSSAIIAFFCYTLLYIPGLIMNIKYLREANKTAMLIGHKPKGYGCLISLLITALLALILYILICVTLFLLIR